MKYQRAHELVFKYAQFIASSFDKSEDIELKLDERPVRSDTLGERPWGVIVWGKCLELGGRIAVIANYSFLSRKSRWFHIFNHYCCAIHT